MCQRFWRSDQVSMGCHMFKLLTGMFAVASAATPAVGDGALLLNAYCSTNTAPRLDFPHQLHVAEDFPDPELLRHVGGFISYVQRRRDAALMHIGEQVIAHLHKVRHHLRISVRREDLARFHAWASEANAIVFRQDGNIYDADGLLLLPADESEADPAAHIPYPEEAYARKMHSESLLAARAITVSASLPPVISVSEVALRSPLQVAERLMALDGGQRDAVQVLAWAIGLAEELPFPDRPGAAFPLRCDLNADITLRPAAELLDALDLHYRLRWALRRAELDCHETPSGIDAALVRERLRVLNWLTCFENAGWEAALM